MSRPATKNKKILASAFVLTALMWPYLTAQAMSLKCEERGDGTLLCASSEPPQARTSEREVDQGKTRPVSPDKMLNSACKEGEMTHNQDCETTVASGGKKSATQKDGRGNGDNDNTWLLPEPGTIALMGVGLGILGIAIRSRRIN